MTASITSTVLIFTQRTWRLLSTLPFSSRDHLEQVGQGRDRLGVGYLQRWRLHNLSQQPEQLLPCVPPVAPLSSPCFLLSLPPGSHTHWWDAPSAFSSAGCTVPALPESFLIEGNAWELRCLPIFVSFGRILHGSSPLLLCWGAQNWTWFCRTASPVVRGRFSSTDLLLLT